MLKELTWQFVIKNPALATQQHGYRLVIEGLFADFLSSAKDNPSLFPSSVQETLEGANDPQIVRIITDFIAMMSESQALEMFQRLRGISIGSFFKSII